MEPGSALLHLPPSPGAAGAGSPGEAADPRVWRSRSGRSLPPVMRAVETVLTAAAAQDSLDLLGLDSAEQALSVAP